MQIKFEECLLPFTSEFFFLLHAVGKHKD